MRDASTLSFGNNTADCRTSSIFQPPISPPSSTSTLSQSQHTSEDYFSSRSRKRNRAQSHVANNFSDYRGASSIASSYGVAAETHNQAVTPVVNERYQLAGGYDTPGLMAVASIEAGRSTHEHPEHWRRLRDGDTFEERHPDGQAVPLSGPLARERNGAARLSLMPDESPSAPGWTSYALSLVGRAFNFSTSVLKGFYAGPGKGYDLQDYSNSSTPPDQSQWEPPRIPQDECSTPVPGSWREYEDYGFRVDQQLGQNIPSTSRPPTKRRQTDRDSWVLVGTPGTPPATVTDGSPRRKSNVVNGLSRNRLSAARAASRKSLAPLSRRQSSNYNIYAHNPSPLNNNNNDHNNDSSRPHTPLQPFERRASFASPRLSSRSQQHSPSTSHLHHNSNDSTRSSICTNGSYFPNTATASNNFNRTSPPRIHNSNSNLETFGTSATTAATAGAGYISPEAERFLKRQARAERAADKAMNSMSQRLETLIRQGQAALGTQVSVSVEDGDYENEKWQQQCATNRHRWNSNDCGRGGGGDDEGFVDYDEGEDEFDLPGDMMKW